MWHGLAGETLCVWYSLLLQAHTHTSHTFSPHTLTGLPLLFARGLLGEDTHAHPSWSGCQNIFRTVSVVKIFSKRCTQRRRGPEGDETQLGSWVDCQRTNGPQTHPYGCPVSRATTTIQGPRRSPAVLDRRNLSYPAYLS